MNAIVERNEQAVAIRSDSASLIEVIGRAASDPSVDIHKMERLLEMHERLQARQAETEFNAAMVQAQGEMRRVAADADNPQTRSKYATYAALDKALRPVYTKHGFAVSYDTGETEIDAVNVIGYVSHQSGHTRRYHVRMPADGKGAKGGDVMTKTHAAGAAMSYGMRYLLKMIFNVAVGEDDTDGNLEDFIAPAQVADLQALIEETGADKPKFLEYMRVGSLDDLPATKYKMAVAALERKRKA